MSNPGFIHLRLHSEYSITDGIVRIGDAVARAVEDGMPALALTDLSNVFGLVKFYQAARSKGIKPIAGCDVWIGHAGQGERPARVLLLVQDLTGYRRLCEWLSRAYRENYVHGRAQLQLEWLEESGTEGLIALSGAQWGDVGQLLLSGNEVGAHVLAQRWARLFPQRYYLEIQRTGHPDAEDCLCRSVKLAERWRLIRCSFLIQPILRRTKHGYVSPKARCWPTNAVHSILLTRNISKPRQK